MRLFVALPMALYLGAATTLIMGPGGAAVGLCIVGLALM